jgi:hypothetical protein
MIRYDTIQRPIDTNLHFVSMEKGFAQILGKSLANPDLKISDTLKILNKSIKLFFSNVLNKYVY